MCVAAGRTRKAQEDEKKVVSVEAEEDAQAGEPGTEGYSDPACPFSLVKWSKRQTFDYKHKRKNNLEQLTPSMILWALCQHIIFAWYSDKDKYKR